MSFAFIKLIIMRSIINWELNKELFSSSSAFLPLIFVLLLTLIVVIGRITSIPVSGDKPPSPWRLPIIGNLHQLISPLPHQRLRDLARVYGPDVMGLQLGELPHIVISSSRAAREVMKTHDVVFASRPSLLGADMVLYGGSDLVFTKYTDTYKQLRKICVVELLGAARVRHFRPIREAEVAQLVRSISSSAAAAAVVDVSKEVFLLSSRVTCRAAFGKSREVGDGFLRMVAEVSDVLGGFKVSDLFPSVSGFLAAASGLKAKLKRMHRELDLILEEIMDEHKERRRVRAAAVTAIGRREGDDQLTDQDADDLVDVLFKLRESGTLQFNLTMDNIKAVTVDVFLAGVETSATVIDWAMAEMMKDQRVLWKAQEEVRKVYRGKQNLDESSIHQLKYLDLVVKESLRLHPALPLLLPRECQETVEICGYKIADKTKVIVNAWAIGRDPHHWIEPNKFYPERFLDSSIDHKGNNFEYIPFGAGRRMCPGMLYASTVVKLTLANLLYHFDWKMPKGVKAENLDMREDFGVSVRRKCSLCLIPLPYAGS